jgi:hypothetical protein
MSLLPALLQGRTGFAQSAESSCQAVEQTESMRAQGNYRAARSRLLECVNAQCGGDVRRRCAATLQKLDAATPSIVVRAEDENGNDVSDVSVSLGDEPLVTALDGMAIAVDPGEHRFVFRRPGHDAVVQTLEIRKGEKFRSIDVKIGTAPAATPAAAEVEHQTEQPSRARLAASLTLFGVGAVGAAGFAWLGTKARSHERVLESCKPECSDGSVDAVSKRYLLANVSLGVSVVSIGVATWLLLSGGSPSAAPTAGGRDGFSLSAGETGAYARYLGHF